MDSAGGSSSAFSSFKVKKLLRSTVNKQHSADEALAAPDLSPWRSKSADQNHTHPPRRSLTRRQVSQAANHLRNLDLKPSASSDPLKSSDALSETLISKPNTSESEKLCAKSPESPINCFDLGENGEISSSLDVTPPELILGLIRTPPAPRKMFPTITECTKRSRCRRSLNFDTFMENEIPPVKRASPSDYDDELSDLLASIEDYKRNRLENNIGG